MIRSTLILAVLMLVAHSIVFTQESDYHYPFDGSVQNVSPNMAFTGSYGEFSYGADRTGKVNASIYFEKL